MRVNPCLSLSAVAAAALLAVVYVVATVVITRIARRALREAIDLEENAAPPRPARGVPCSETPNDTIGVR